MKLHAPIQAFLDTQNIIALAGDVEPFADQQYMKAGVIPFVCDASGMSYLLMKPQPKNPKNPPAFQICKGTRMYLHRGSGWRDMRPGDEPVEGKESLVMTALREGIEEVGLELDAITALYDVGPYKFSSESTGKNKYMWLFAARLTSADALLPMQEVAASTFERKWLTAEEFAESGREDHRAILADIEGKLKLIG